jgi:hypothetical protein
MWFLSLIPGLFNTVNGITNAIANERLAKIKAKTDEEKVRAEESISTLQARRDVLVARASHPWDAMATFLFSLIVLGFDAKTILWDKVIGSFLGCTMKDLTPVQLNDCAMFRTDNLTTEQWAFVGAVHMFYFLYIGTRK